MPSQFLWDEDPVWVHRHTHPLRLHPSSWWGAEPPPHIPVRERESEEEDDVEGWGLKPHLFVGWQKLANTTIAISHSRSLSDYTDLLWNVEVSVEGVWGVQGGRVWASEHRSFPPSAHLTRPISRRSPVFYLHNRRNTGSPSWGWNWCQGNWELLPVESSTAERPVLVQLSVSKISHDEALRLKTTLRL